jgi:hypothetical protein
LDGLHRRREVDLAALGERPARGRRSLGRLFAKQLDGDDLLDDLGVEGRQEKQQSDRTEVDCRRDGAGREGALALVRLVKFHREVGRRSAAGGLDEGRAHPGPGSLGLRAGS